MQPEGFFNYNGKLYKNEKAVISVNNRSFRYGDGCFETMKMLDGKVVLWSYHLERIFTSLQKMSFNKPNFFITDLFKEELIEVARRNHHKKSGRIRLTIFRGDGGLYDVEDHTPNYIIQSWDLNSSNNKPNENGLVVDIYTEARKINDGFSHIKSNNYLCYAMAALWAKELKLNDAILLNTAGNITDSTIANIFIVQNGIIKTPALAEGPVGGTMRKYLLKCMRDANMKVEETTVTVDDLKTASEIFFTNAIYGIKWVKEIGQNTYDKNISVQLYKKFLTQLWS